MNREGEEFEIVKYPRVDNINIFFVNLINRTAHLHGDMEFCYLMGGEFLIRSRGVEFPASRGSLLFFNSHEPHSLKRLEGPSPLLSLQISPGLCKKVFPGFENISFTSPRVLDGTDRAWRDSMTGEIYRLTRDYFRGGPGFELSVASGILRLFSRMMEGTEYKVIDREESLRNRERQTRLTRITAYINENLGEKITLTGLAERENLSPTYLSHFFRNTLDITFGEYVSNLRFERAARLMGSTGLSNLDICLETGFSDRKYMNKAFLHNCGCTPREYREHLSRGKGGNESRPLRDHPLTNQYIYSDGVEIGRLLEDLRDLTAGDREETKQ